ncbi:MAG: thioredoxin family protein [Desulfobacterales bacterium]
MRIKNWAGPILFWVLIFAGSPGLASNAEINWTSYQSGMEKIADENKKGFIHFYTDWCTYCKLMDQKTFSDDSVIAFLNENFVSIRVDAEEQQSVAKKYGASSFPTNGFIAEDQSEIGKRPGFIPPDLLLKMLEFIDSESFKTMNFKEFMDQ